MTGEMQYNSTQARGAKELGMEVNVYNVTSIPVSCERRYPPRIMIHENRN